MGENDAREQQILFTVDFLVTLFRIRISNKRGCCKMKTVVFSFGFFFFGVGGEREENGEFEGRKWKVKKNSKKTQLKGRL